METTYTPKDNKAVKTALFLVLIIVIIIFLAQQGSNRLGTLNKATVYDATPKKLVSTRISANILETQIPILLDSRLPLWQALHLTNYYFSSAVGTKNSTDIATLNSFSQATGAQIDTLFDMPNMTNADMDAQIANFHPQYIEFNQESQEGKNIVPNDIYSSLATSFMSYLSNRAIPVLDGALVYRSNSAAVARRNTVAAIQGTYDVRQYIQINDIIGFTTDMNSNAAKLDDYFTNTSPDAQSLPAFLTKFFQYYPHARKEAVIQWNVEDFTNAPVVSGSNLSNWAMGKTVEFVMRHTDSISYLAWMSLGNLVNQAAHQINTPKTEYYTLKRLATLFHMKYEQDYNSGLFGVTGLLFSNDDGTSALLLNNKTGTQYTIAGSNFPNVVGSTFIRDTGWATSWSPPAANEVVTETGTITVRPYSVSVVQFTVSQSIINPAVSIVAPANNATLPAGTITVSFTAAPGSQAIDHTELDVNNQFVATGAGNATSFNYDATNVSGATTFTVKAFDHDGHVGQASVTITFTPPIADGSDEDPTKTYIHLEIMNPTAEARIGNQSYVYVLPTNYNTSTVATLIQNQLEHAMDVGQGRAQQDQSHFPYVYYATSSNGVLNTFTYISVRNLPPSVLSAVETWLLGVANAWTPGMKVAYNTNAAYQKIAMLASVAGALHADCSDGIDNDSDGFNNYPSDPGCTSLGDINETSFTGGGSSDTTAPAISAISASPSQNNATITWTTNEASSSKVDYGATNYYGSTTSETDTGGVTSHIVTLSALSSDTTYHYRVKSTDTSGNLATSTDYVFTTLAPQGSLTTPTITGSNPASNTSTTTTPKIIGIATNNSIVKIYTNQNCTGSVVGSGSAATFGSSGITANVAPGSLTAFYASASIGSHTSNCSERFAYKALSNPS